MWKSKYVENCVDIFGLSGTTKIIDIIYTGLSEHRMEYPMYGIRVATSIGNFMINQQTIGYANFKQPQIGSMNCTMNCFM